MSGGHAPYIMPDGRPLAHHLRVERERDAAGLNRHKKHRRGKDDLWHQLQHSKVTASSDQEVQEIRAIEHVGHRRRRRWLNDKFLRDMAGPMTAHDMESQFKPVPFGSYPPPSVFSIAMAAEHAPLWDHFRNIDSDKEAKVLERWEHHNRQLRQQQLSVSGNGPITQHQQQEAAAALALHKWQSVSRSARAALKKANVHSVLELEMQVLQVLEQDNPTLKVLLDLPDGFARLLVHGLTEFHGLLSSTRVHNGEKRVAVYWQPRSQQEQQSPSSLSQQQQRSSQSAADAAGFVDLSSSSAEQQSNFLSGHNSSSAEAVGYFEGSRGAEWLLQQHDITCTDVVMALHQLGAGFDQHALRHYMRTHVHGTNSDVNSDELLLV